ncbi:MAG: hypothetical protein FJ290_30510 [Planctomycetes bacterium]|nr:hypothetical protein [Planctomycetota bacterium]
MFHAIRTEVIVQPGGRIEIPASELSPGTQAEVIVLEQPAPRKKRPFFSFFGKGKGCFRTPEEADAFLRRERDSLL